MGNEILARRRTQGGSCIPLTIICARQVSLAQVPTQTVLARMTHCFFQRSHDFDERPTLLI